MRKKLIWTVCLLATGIGIVSFAKDNGSNYFEISKNLDIFATLFKELDTYYVDNIEPGKLIRKGIDAMLESLDPYTNYISEDDIEDYRIMTTGVYGGIGAIIRPQGNYIGIAEPYEGFPAYKAGLRAGDMILEIDGKSTKGFNTDNVTDLLRGAPGTDITLTIQHPGSDKTEKVTFKRDDIKTGSVPYSGMLPGDVAYVRLTQFTENCGQDVQDALEKLKLNNPNIKGYILDLRSNPGGLLNEAVNVANIFTDKGQLVVNTRGKMKDWDKEYRTLNSSFDTKTPLVVLTNSGSASASEIVSGTMQDLDRGVILGQKTFGKGLVQTTRMLSYNTQLKVTTAHYFTPSGRCIQALDYSHRNADGSVGKIPDSLKTAFKTQDGRTVYDGGGIEPDVATPRKEYPAISVALSNQYIIFDYVTDYVLKHPSISSAKDFSISPADYEAFIQFAKGKNFKYTTYTERLLDSTIKQSERDKFASLKESVQTIETKLEADKQNNFNIYKDDIMQLINEEIVSRYYFQKGRIQNSLSHDKDVQKAIDVLSNTVMYTSLLKQPTSK